MTDFEERILNCTDYVRDEVDDLRYLGCDEKSIHLIIDSDTFGYVRKKLLVYGISIYKSDYLENNQMDILVQWT